MRYARTYRQTRLILRPAMASERYKVAGHPELADGTTIPNDVALRAISHHRLVVAEVEGEVVGWVYLGSVGEEACIGQISVTPQFSRLGIGTALLVHGVE